MIAGNRTRSRQKILIKATECVEWVGNAWPVLTPRRPRLLQPWVLKHQRPREEFQVTVESPKELSHERTTQFIELLTAHQRKLYGYISTMLLGDPAAADVLQDTNLDLWARAQDFDFERPFLPWAFGFARQKVLTFRRSHSRSRLVFNEAAIDMISDACMKYASEADDRLTALRKCVQKLDAQQSELLRERYVSKTSVRMMAARFSDTAHNISSRLHRIRKLLAKCIETTLATEEV